MFEVGSVGHEKKIVKTFNHLNNNLSRMNVRERKCIKQHGRLGRNESKVK